MNWNGIFRTLHSVRHIRKTFRYQNKCTVTASIMDIKQGKTAKPNQKGSASNVHTLNKNSQVAMGDLDRKQDKQAIHSYVTRSKVPKDRNPEDMKEYYLKMTLEDKRKKYKCGKKFLPLSDVPTWPEYYSKLSSSKEKPKTKKHQKPSESDSEQVYPVKADINKKVSLWQGDITCLEIDAIVNAANSSLLGGGGVDGAIHSAAGSNLVAECRTLHGCKTGQAKITGGYKLPARHVIHTVGPIGRSKEEESDQRLESCYNECLLLMSDHKLKSMALPCISTGIYGFPTEIAANIAVKAVRQFLDKHADAVDRIIFCVFLPQDKWLYEKLLLKYFPLENLHPSNTDPSEKESESQSVEMDTEDSSNKSKRKSASQGSVEPTSNPDKNQSALHENMSTENMSTEDGVSRHDNTMSQPVKNSTEGSPSKSDGNGSVLCQSEAPPDEEEMDVKKDSTEEMDHTDSHPEKETSSAGEALPHRGKPTRQPVKETAV